MSVTKEQFIGGWSLVSWEINYDGGRTTHPFGTDPQGQLLYTSDGHMSGAICRAGRAKLEPDNVRASEADKLGAASSYFHYAGRWHLEGDVAVHEVEFSLNPNMVGTTQHRNAQFDGDRLTLSADETIGDGRIRHHALVWVRGGA